VEKQIPNPLRYLFPEMVAETYHNLRGTALAASTQVDICYSCYFELSRYHPLSGEQLTAWIGLEKNKVKGTRHMYPEINVSTLIRKVIVQLAETREVQS